MSLMFPIKDDLANKGIFTAKKNIIKSNNQNYRRPQTSLNPHTFWTNARENKELSRSFFAAYYI